MENKDIIYNKIDDSNMPIDTSARDMVFESDATKARRQMDKRDEVADTSIDTSAEDMSFESDAAMAKSQMEEHDRTMTTPIDTSASTHALRAELERARRVLEEQQAMNQKIENSHKHM